MIDIPSEIWKSSNDEHKLITKRKLRMKKRKNITACRMTILPAVIKIYAL
jgi:hypothetical protein